MLARKIRPDEMHKIDLISCVAFECPWEPPKPETKNEEHKSTMSFWIAEEGDAFLGCLAVHPMNVRFDGHLVGMGGIGGVATLPQHRRRGAIRACMNASLADMREQGNVFSVLYPFSRAYYRQFGYEDGAAVTRWNIPFSALRLPDVGGTIELIIPGSDLSALEQLYADCAQNWNLSSEKTVMMRELSNSSWMKDKRYLYIWRDENGTPGGMMLFTKQNRVMDCVCEFGKPNQLLFRDARALTALLNFAKTFAADYDSIRFDAPQGVRVQSLFSEGNDAEGRIHYQGMARLVNVPKALEMCRTTGEGSIVIAVEDKILSENSGAWKVTFAEGGSKVERCNEAPDVEMPVGELTQLLLGICCSDDLPMMPRVKINNPNAPFAQIFMRKACHIIDLF